MALTSGSIWRVTRGPNNDWPLALCDYRTVDIHNDTTPNDVVGTDFVLENSILYSNDAHKWYHMQDMCPSDCLVFRQGGLDPNKPGE
jgi:hypothetical protein